MLGLLTSPFGSSNLRTFAGGLLVFLGAACAGDGVGPSPESVVPADSLAAPADSTIPADTTLPAPADSTGVPAAPPVDSSSIGEMDTSSPHPGIVFGTFTGMSTTLNTFHTGAVRGGITPTSTPKMLAEAKAKGLRLVIKLSGGHESMVENADGTFSYAKWKALVDRFKTVNLAPYIADGTIIGHFLVDEPNMAPRWGGKVIPQATIESMAQYSKQLWPSMTTFARVGPTWLASSTITYTYLDAGWAQYQSSKGDPARWVAAEVAAAKSKRLGLMVGINALAGGNGSSGIPRVQSNWAPPMGANEIRVNGNAMLNQSYACGFFLWTNKADYNARPDINAALTELSVKARAHVKTSCRQ
jgi:hypothetical protein